MNLPLTDLVKKIDEIELNGVIEDMKDCIIYLMTQSCQFSLYHLLTTNSQHHESLKVFYEELQEQTDEIAEIIISKYNLNVEVEPVNSEEEWEYNIEEAEYNCELYLGYNYFRCIEDIDDIEDYMVSMINLIDSTENKALVEEFVEIQEACAKLKYKMKMN